MTPQASRIFRAFTRGESIARIAESRGVSYAQAWLHLRRAVSELDRKNPSALDAVRWQQYLALMRIADQAFAAFEKSAEEGVREIASQTIERADDSGKLRLTGKGVTRSVRKGAGDVRFLEVAMKALREVRDLFGIGAEAESKLNAASPEGGLALEALMRTGAARLTTRWAESVESGTQPRQPLE
jgi:histone H3/H4